MCFMGEVPSQPAEMAMTRHLDTTDIVLIQMLLSNSRASETEIAGFLLKEPEEVRRRIQALIDDGIISGFITRLTPKCLRSVGVLIFGSAEITSLDDAIARVTRNDATSWVGVASGGRLYAGASLRRLSHLDSYMHFLREEIGMRDLVFGIRTGPVAVKQEAPIVDLDFRILHAMRKDPRKSAFEVAEEVGETTTGVEDHLKSMIENGWVEFSVILAPEKASDVQCMFHLHRKGPGEMRDFMREKLNEHSPNILFFNSYRNLPDMIMAMSWNNDMGEVREIKASFEGSGRFERVEPNVLIGSRAVEGWGDRLILERGRANR
jgi:DNA-binding Lrp family transcriptional regulator